MNRVYIEGLGEYLLEESDSDRIVVARTRIAPAVKLGMERLVGKSKVRAIIYS